MKNTFPTVCLVGLICLVALCGTGRATAADTAAAVAKALAGRQVVKKATVARLTIKGPLSESPNPLLVLGERELKLRELIARLDKAATDKDVSAVLLRVRNPAVGRGKIAELRAAIHRTRQSGKRVYAELEAAKSADYLVAAACDEIVMPESGMLVIPGVRAEVMFYKNLLDKLGVKADLLQIGDFKGAAEPLTRTGMSPQFHKQYDKLVDDLYEQTVEWIAADRKLEKSRVKQLLDTGMFTPAAAQQAGLIDRVAYEDQLHAILKRQLAADKLVVLDGYGKKKLDGDLTGMIGMAKLLELMTGVRPMTLPSRNKKIAVVYAVGAITSGSSGTSLFGSEIVGSDTIVRALRKAAEDRTVAAIVLRVDSPGGSGLGSDLIWREIRGIEKPVVASMGDVAASGGYYISMGCDKIYAEPGTLTGSIGVVGGKLALGGLYDKIGVKTEVIDRGKNSGLFSTESPFTDSERKVFLGAMKAFYKQFVAKAAEGRKMKLEKIEPLAAGRVWTGRQAKANGLVDEIGTLEDAVAEAGRMAGIKPDEKTEPLILPEPKSLFEQLFGGASAQAQVGHAADAILPEASKHLGRIETLRRLFAEPSVLILPYRVEIK